MSSLNFIESEPFTQANSPVEIPLDSNYRTFVATLCTFTPKRVSAATNDYKGFNGVLYPSHSVIVGDEDGVVTFSMILSNPLPIDTTCTLRFSDVTMIDPALVKVDGVVSALSGNDLDLTISAGNTQVEIELKFITDGLVTDKMHSRHDIQFDVVNVVGALQNHMKSSMIYVYEIDLPLMDDEGVIKFYAKKYEDSDWEIIEDPSTQAIQTLTCSSTPEMMKRTFAVDKMRLHAIKAELENVTRWYTLKIEQSDD